jgi:GntR family transcriptional regulator
MMLLMKTPNGKTDAPIDFSRSAVSRYVQLASLFRHRVESGDWPVGAQIPTADDLAAACSVAVSRS